VGIAVLGAFWASRAAAHAGGPLTGGAIGAPAAAQVSALRDTLLVAASLVAVALGLGIWSLVQVRQARRARAAGAQRPSERPTAPLAAG
jgi:hypothetical protein